MKFLIMEPYIARQLKNLVDGIIIISTLFLNSSLQILKTSCRINTGGSFRYYIFKLTLIAKILQHFTLAYLCPYNKDRILFFLIFIFSGVIFFCYLSFSSNRKCLIRNIFSNCRTSGNKSIITNFKWSN